MAEVNLSSKVYSRSELFTRIRTNTQNQQEVKETDNTLQNTLACTHKYTQAIYRLLRTTSMNTGRHWPSLYTVDNSGLRADGLSWHKEVN